MTRGTAGGAESSAGPFDALHNFRDIGGHLTEDGRRVRPSLLFRSGDLSGASARDVERLRLLGIKTVVDLRTPSERAARPDRFPPGGEATVVPIPIYHDRGDFPRGKMMSYIFGKTGGAEFDTFMESYYRSIAFEGTAEMCGLLELVSDESSLPALVHCSAGKDRTGFAAAVIQLLLGVPRRTVLDDYLATNRSGEYRVRRLVTFIRWVSLFRVSQARVRQVLEAGGDRLESVLDEVAGRFGSIEGYAVEACGVGPESIARLRRTMLEAP